MISIGTLSVVATPIGNLKDITLRAIETLQAADLVACEDTRHSAVLFRTHNIHVPTTSFHSYSSPGKLRKIVEALRNGQHVALISDAGLPGISDPGLALVREVIAAKIPVTVLPGASASLVGLILSGFATNRFLFEGFLPIKPGPRRTRLEAVKAIGCTTILYESPHRLVKTLEAIEAVFGDIPLSCSRELTKRFEETRRERVSHLRAHFTERAPKGEFVLVLPPQRPDRHGE